MTQLIKNAARAALAAGIAAADTSLTVDITKADLFPAANTGTDPVNTVGKDWFKIVVEDASHNYEIMYVRTRTLGSAVMGNLLRGQEGTTAISFSAGSIVGNRITAKDYESALDLAAVASAYGKSLLGTANAPAARTALDVPGLSIENTFTANQNFTSINGGQLAGFRNKIINGAFQIKQRGYVSGAATTAGQYTFDRWKVTGTGGITFSTVNNKTTVTIPAGQTLQQVIEGLNLQTGTYVLSWEGTAQGRIAGGSYGASGAVTASITGGADATIEFNTGTVSNVQLEFGTVATSFEYMAAGDVLAKCLRYCQKTPQIDIEFYGITDAANVVNFRLLAEMRAAPTVTQPTFTLANATSALIKPLGSNNALLAASVAANGYTRIRCSTDGIFSAEL